MLFSKTFFCPADDLVAHELILLYAKGSSVSHRAVYRQLKAQRIILLLILTRFLRSDFKILFDAKCEMMTSQRMTSKELKTLANVKHLNTWSVFLKCLCRPTKLMANELKVPRLDGRFEG